MALVRSELPRLVQVKRLGLLRTGTGEIRILRLVQVRKSGLLKVALASSELLRLV